MKKRLIWHVRGLLIAPYFASSLACAVNVGGVELPDVWSLGSPASARTLVLNNAGVREYSFLRIPVYAAALYLPARQSSENAILATTAPRVVYMKMLRDVSREDSVKAWELYLAANCKPPCLIKADIRQKFLGLVPDARASDTQTFVFLESSVEIFRNNTSVGAVSDAVLARAVLASWIGEVPTTIELKNQLLGLVR